MRRKGGIAQEILVRFRLFLFDFVYFCSIPCLNCAKRGALWPDTSPKRRGFYRRHRSGADRRKRFQAECTGPLSGLRRGPRPRQYITPSRLARIGGACAEPCACSVRCGYCGPAPQSPYRNEYGRGIYGIRGVSYAGSIPGIRCGNVEVLGITLKNAHLTFCTFDNTVMLYIVG